MTLSSPFLNTSTSLTKVPDANPQMLSNRQANGPDLVMTVLLRVSFQKINLMKMTPCLRTSRTSAKPRRKRNQMMTLRIFQRPKASRTKKYRTKISPKNQRKPKAIVSHKILSQDHRRSRLNERVRGYKLSKKMGSAEVLGTVGLASMV